MAKKYIQLENSDLFGGDFQLLQNSANFPPALSCVMSALAIIIAGGATSCSHFTLGAYILKCSICTASAVFKMGNEAASLNVEKGSSNNVKRRFLNGSCTFLPLSLFHTLNWAERWWRVFELKVVRKADPK